MEKPFINFCNEKYSDIKSNNSFIRNVILKCMWEKRLKKLRDFELLAEQSRRRYKIIEEND